jgi:hypothetical protein
LQCRALWVGADIAGHVGLERHDMVDASSARCRRWNAPGPLTVAWSSKAAFRRRSDAVGVVEYADGRPTPPAPLRSSASDVFLVMLSVLLVPGVVRRGQGRFPSAPQRRCRVDGPFDEGAGRDLALVAGLVGDAWVMV